MLDTLLRGVGNLVCRRPRLIIFAAILLTLAALAGARQLALVTDLTQLLPERGEDSRALRAFLARFATGDRLLISINLAGDSPDAVDLLDEAGADLTERLRATGLFHDVADRVDEDALEVLRFGLDHLPALLEPDLHAELGRRLSPPAMRAALRELRLELLARAGDSLESLAAEDPLSLRQLLPLEATTRVGGFSFDLRDGLFLSTDRRSLLVLGEPVRPPFDTGFSRKLLETVEREIRAVAAALPPAARAHFHVAGGYRMAVADEAALRRDLTVTALVSLTGVLLVFWLVFRRPGAIGLAAAPLAMSACWSLGLAAAWPGHLNAVTVGFAAILLGLGDDSALHFYNRFAEERRRGADPEACLRAAILGSGRPILAANLTTALGFGLLLFTGFRALAELALLALYGIVSLTVAMLVVLPALLRLASGSIGPESEGGSLHDPRPPLPRLESQLARVMARPRLWLALAGGAAAMAAACVPDLSFDLDLHRLRDPDSAALRDEREILDRFGGSADTDFLIRLAPDADHALAAADALRPALQQAQDREEILGFELPHRMLRPAGEQARVFEACRKAGVLTGASARLREELSRQGFRLDTFEPALARLAQWEKGEGGLYDFGREAERLPRWLVRQHFRFSPEGVWLAVPVHRLPTSPEEPFPEELRREAGRQGFQLASLGAALRETQRAVLRDFRSLALVAPLLVLGVVWALLGRLQESILALLPMSAGVLAALALATVLGIPIGTLTLVVTPLLFGLGVDYGIYVVHRWLEATGTTSAAGVAAAARTVVMTSATTFIAFASLSLANFRGLREIGLLTAGGIVAAVIAALTALPAALALASRRRFT